MGVKKIILRIVTLLENRPFTSVLLTFLHRLRCVVVAGDIENPRPYNIDSMINLEGYGYEDRHSVRPILES